MACVLSMPHLDLSHSQYLWPSAAVELRSLAANASARAEYKALLQREYESSLAFQKQFAIFVAQLVHQQQRVTNLSAISPESLASTLSRHSAIPKPTLLYPCSTPLESLLNTHRRHTIILIPPRPRLSSVLSSAPPNTPLAGPLRRPMPPRRARAAPEVTLLRQALLNSAHGRATAHGSRTDVMKLDEELGQNWEFVSREDWEIIDTKSSS